MERLVRHYHLSMDDVDQEGRCAIQVACINNCPDVLDCLIRTPGGFWFRCALGQRTTHLE